MHHKARFAGSTTRLCHCSSGRAPVVAERGSRTVEKHDERPSLLASSNAAHVNSTPKRSSEKKHDELRGCTLMLMAIAWKIHRPPVVACRSLLRFFLRSKSYISMFWSHLAPKGEVYLPLSPALECPPFRVCLCACMCVRVYLCVCVSARVCVRCTLSLYLLALI